MLIPRIMHYISFALHFICITFKKSATSAWNACHIMIFTTFISWNANVMQNPLFNKFFAFSQQLSPCQVAIRQHLRDMAKALRKLKQQLYWKQLNKSYLSMRKHGMKCMMFSTANIHLVESKAWNANSTNSPINQFLWAILACQKV